jgi:CubicO group peptidase (beta-lactamase class C family)
MTAAVPVDRIEAVFDRFAASRPVPGLAWAVLAEGDVAAVGCSGWSVLERLPVRPDSVFRIASMTKSFTAAATLLLRDEGRLRLDEPIVTFVPELARARPRDSHWARTTLRHLLTMSAGLPFDDPWADRQQEMPLEDFIRLLEGGLNRVGRPGERYEYSNLGYAILGLALGRAAGIPYGEFVASRLVQPLGLDSTTFDPTRVAPGQLACGYRSRDGRWVAEAPVGDGAFSPMGGLLSSVGDVATWTAGLLTAFRTSPGRARPTGTGPSGSPGSHPLAAATRLEMQTIQVPWPPTLEWSELDRPPRATGGGYGFGLQVLVDPAFGAVVGHGGGYPGFGSAMWWHPSTGSGVVVLTNATYARPKDAALEALAVLVAGRPPRRASRSSGVRQAQRAIERLLGNWQAGLATETFAPCVELDWGEGRLEETFAELAARHGPFRRDRTSEALASGSNGAAWWVQGRGARIRLAILLSPQRPPRVQHLELRLVPEPAPSLRRAAHRVGRGFGRGRPGSDGGPSVDVAARVYAVTHLGDAVDGDGTTWASFRLRPTEPRLELTVRLDPESGRLVDARVGLTADP